MTAPEGSLTMPEIDACCWLQACGTSTTDNTQTSAQPEQRSRKRRLPSNRGNTCPSRSDPITHKLPKALVTVDLRFICRLPTSVTQHPTFLRKRSSILLSKSQ